MQSHINTTTQSLAFVGNGPSTKPLCQPNAAVTKGVPTFITAPNINGQAKDSALTRMTGVSMSMDVSDNQITRSSNISTKLVSKTSYSTFEQSLIQKPQV